MMCFWGQEKAEKPSDRGPLAGRLQRESSVSMLPTCLLAGCSLIHQGLECLMVQ